MIKYHTVSSINGCMRHLNSIKNKDKRKLWTYEIFGVSNDDFLRVCEECKNKGYTVIPSGDCDNIGLDGHCLGHKE